MRGLVTFVAGFFVGVITLAALGAPFARPSHTLATVQVSRTGRLAQERSSSAYAALPVWPNDLAIPVWDEQAKPQFVSASQRPVLLFSIRNPGPAQKILSMTKGAVYLVATDFPSASMAKVAGALGSVSLGLPNGVPVDALQGAWEPYTKSLPSLIYMGVWGSTPKIIPWSQVTPAGVEKALQATNQGILARGQQIGK